MKLYKLSLIVLCLAMLLGLAACVEAKAKEQDAAAAAADQGVPLQPAQGQDTATLPHKTPIDAVEGKSDTDDKVQKDVEMTDGLLIDIGEDYDADLIPVPKPVEPPVEEQSAESSAAEE